MSSIKKDVQLRADGATTLASGGTLSVRLDQIQPVASMARGHTYLRELVLEFAINAVGNGADAIGEDHLHDFVESLILRVPGLDRNVYELPVKAGSRLRYFLHAVNGKREPAANGGAGGAVTPAGGGGSAYRCKIRVPFEFDNFERPADFNMPIAFLREAADLQLRYGALAAGYGGANITVTGSLTRVTARLIEKAEFNLPVFFAVQHFAFNQLTGQIPTNGRTFAQAIEVAAQADAAGQGTIADAARDDLTYNLDGRLVVERVDVQSQVMDWNLNVARARAEELADMASGTNSWVPHVTPVGALGKAQLTKVPLAIGRPQYTFTGTDDSPELVVFSTDLNTEQASLARIARANVAVPAGFAASPGSYLRAKTASKQPTLGGADGAARLPLRLLDSPVGGRA